jgi:hypothetical protein
MWSPPPESNRRPHPYHGTTRNRCADRRFPSSRSTVGAEVIGSLPTKLCALFQPCAGRLWVKPESAPGDYEPGPILDSIMVRSPRQSSPATCSYARSELPCWCPPLQSRPLAHAWPRHARASSFQSSVAAVRWSSVGGPVPLAKVGPPPAAGAIASGSARSAATSPVASGFMAIGTSTIRTRVASRRMVAARPTPISLSETSRPGRERAKHGDRSMAATREPHPSRIRLAGA